MLVEVWLRHQAPASETSAPDLGPHAQDNQNLLPRREPTPTEWQAMMDIFFIASLQSHENDIAKPKTARNKALEERNGATTRVQTATHTHPCKKCAAAGKQSWFASKKSLKRHEDKHDTEPQACILCGETIDGRGDMPGTHRQKQRCVVHNQLRARGGEAMVKVWADYWGLKTHKQWGRDGPK